MKPLLTLSVIALSISSIGADARLLVKTNVGYAVSMLDRDLSRHGGKRVGHLKEIDVYIVETKNAGLETALLKALQRNRHIKWVEIDKRVPPGLAVNDPLYPNQWHHPILQSHVAWDSSTGVGVIIASLDSGIHASHPDLAPRLVAGWNIYDNNSNTADVSGHGTKTAGTAAAAGNNAIGVVGVAFGAQIMPIRITDLQGYGYISTIAAGINWAADHGARVAYVPYAPIWGSPTVISAAQYMRNKNGVVYVSAGNTGAYDSTPSTPYISVLAASDQSHNPAGFSTYGPGISFTAPGVTIWTTDGTGSYGSTAGTSFASPIAAGIAALMIAANPKITSAQIDKILCDTASDISTAGKDERTGCGLVRAERAVAAAKAAISVPSIDTTPPTVSITEPANWAVVTGLITVKVTATDAVGVVRTELNVGSAILTDTSAPYAYSLDTTKYPNGDMQITARAIDAAGNISAASSVIKIQNDADSGGKGKKSK